MNNRNNNNQRPSTPRHSRDRAQNDRSQQARRAPPQRDGRGFDPAKNSRHSRPDQRDRRDANHTHSHRGNSNAGSQKPVVLLTKPVKPARVIETHTPKKYGIVFYDTFAQARADLAKLAELTKQFDQLNIVVKAEGDMNDPELRKFGVVFAGAAWHLIHTRRVEENWYSEPR